MGQSPKGTEFISPARECGVEAIGAPSPFRDGTSHVAHTCCQFRALRI